MSRKEFLRAVAAYVEHRATSWQTFIVEDHFESFKHELDVLELHRESEVKEIYERMKAKIHARIQAME